MALNFCRNLSNINPNVAVFSSQILFLFPCSSIQHIFDPNCSLRFASPLLVMHLPGGNFLFYV